MITFCYNEKCFHFCHLYQLYYICKRSTSLYDLLLAKSQLAITDESATFRQIVDPRVKFSPTPNPPCKMILGAEGLSYIAVLLSLISGSKCKTIQLYQDLHVDVDRVQDEFCNLQKKLWECTRYCLV